MKKLLYLLAFILFSSSASAQNWNLFPLNQKSWYFEESTDQAGAVVFTVMDSIRTISDTTIHYFRKNLDVFNSGDCKRGIIDYPRNYIYTNNKEYFPDSLIRKNDTIFFFSNQPGYFFLPMANPGQSWTCQYYQHTFTISCVTKQIETFLGVTDSVKTFTVSGSLGNIEYKLSKNYGFIKYPSTLFNINRHLSPTLILTAMENNGVHHGFRQPEFESYFALNPGDLLYWENYIENNFTDPATITTRYFLDSIINVHRNQDTVIYFYDRTITDEDENLIDYLSNQQRIFTKDLLNPAFTTPSGWMFVSSALVPRNRILYPSLTYIIEGNDTIITTEIYDEAYHLVEDECYVIQSTEHYESNFFTNTIGHSKHQFETMDYNSRTEIIDSRVTPVTHTSGTLNFNQSPQINKGFNGLKLYPNPASEILHISGAREFIWEISSLQGMHLKSGEASGNTISIEDLPAGIYLLTLEKNSQKVVRKFVKQ